MKVLDVCCGLGGWSVPFVEDGDEVVGIDIVPFKDYPGQQIIQDICTVDGQRFAGFDFIVGSPPCNEFSIAKEKAIGAHPGLVKRDIVKGLLLVQEFKRIVREANPKLWAMENVEAMTKYYSEPPQWHFMVSKGGKRCLWSNFTISLSPQFRFTRKIRDIPGWAKTRPLRAKIPYSIARFIANTVKQQLEARTV